MLKIKKSILLNKKISKNYSEAISCPGSKKFSLICSSRGRRTEFCINDEKHNISSESDLCYEGYSDCIDISVLKGHLWLEKCIFFGREP